jgi:hypothetical protein
MFFSPLIIVKYRFAFICESSVTYFVSKFVLKNKYQVLAPFLNIQIHPIVKPIHESNIIQYNIASFS